MCAIFGIFDYLGKEEKSSLVSQINSMSKRMRYRGPDNYGFFMKKINLLSIIDLHKIASTNDLKIKDI